MPGDGVVPVSGTERGHDTRPRAKMGRCGEVRGLYVGNDRFGPDVKGAASRSPCVRFGSALYPNYAEPGMGGNYQGGYLLTPEEADELAGYLLRCSAWAKAQRALDGAVPDVSR